MSNIRTKLRQFRYWLKHDLFIFGESQAEKP